MVSEAGVRHPAWLGRSSETGYNTASAPRAGGARGISESAQGKYIPRLLLEQFRGGILHTFLYEFMDQKDTATVRQDYQNYWGLMHTDGSPSGR